MESTTTEISKTIGRVGELQPEWLRVPDAVRLSGIGRSHLYQLIERGRIRSVCLRERQKVRGIRLVNVSSLHHYIASFEGKEAVN
jgi:hypothetical protein